MAEEKLSEEEQVAFRESFKKFAIDGGDVIKTDDMAAVLRASGQAPTETELEDFKKELDARDTGEVEYKDILELYSRIMKSTLEMDDELTNAFRVFDKNLDGFITAADLRRHMTTLGEKLTDEEVDEMIKDADTNGDGKINYNEFSFAIIHDNT
ncbi:neo-calmodulin-like [Clavelina lepadiformis]|uniref:neo-calmodulin-like n=1 Tax=Clavelina lepadiformis TaxID=159417 RepID=UPI0040420A77